MSALALLVVLHAACADRTPGACEIYASARADHPAAAAQFDAAVAQIRADRDA